MFNRFIRLDDEPQVMITIVEDGAEKQVPGYLYRCEGRTSMGTCNLVWDRARLAKECADRDHKQSFNMDYVSRDGTQQRYIRQAVRRDRKSAPVATPPVPAPTPLEAAMALVKASGFRVSKAPKPKEALVSEIEGDSELPF